MKILICGADGFIGSALAAQLAAAGHQVVRGVRRPRRDGDVAIDYRRDHAVADWLPRLGGVDAVINAVGILHERRAGDFDAIHTAAPRALFSACVEAGVGRVIQVSALGAALDAPTAYLRSKAAADTWLAGLPLRATVLRPTLVFGAGGTSARFFMALARLPLCPVPGDGRQRVQPVHVDDLVGAVAKLLTLPVPPALLDAPGARPLAYRDMLACYRRAQGWAPAPCVEVPMAVMQAAARCGRWLPGGLLSPDTLAMLARGNTGDPAAFAALLGRAPRGVEDFVPQAPAGAHASPSPDVLPRLALAALWLGSALASVSLAGGQNGFDLLAQAGIADPLAPWLLYGGAAADALVGLLCLLRPGRWLWRLQIGLVLFYTAFVSATMPLLWAHPFGPLLKNLPILALLAVLLRAAPTVERAR